MGLDSGLLFWATLYIQIYVQAGNLKPVVSINNNNSSNDCKKTGQPEMGICNRK